MSRELASVERRQMRWAVNRPSGTQLSEADISRLAWFERKRADLTRQIVSLASLLALLVTLTGCVLPAKWEGPEVIYRADGGTMVCQKYREYGPEPVRRWWECAR